MTAQREVAWRTSGVRRTSGDRSVGARLGDASAQRAGREALVKGAGSRRVRWCCIRRLPVGPTFEVSVGCESAARAASRGPGHLGAHAIPVAREREAGRGGLSGGVGSENELRLRERLATGVVRRADSSGLREEGEFRTGTVTRNRCGEDRLTRSEMTSRGWRRDDPRAPRGALPCRSRSKANV
jgi:hypothetical protein